MTWLLVLLASTSIMAHTNLKCAGVDSAYEIEGLITDEVVKELTYSYDGVVFKSFSNLSYSDHVYKIPFFKDVRSFNVEFKNAFYYLDINRIISRKGITPSEGKGYFIPRNSPLGLEYELKCRFSKIESASN